MSNIEWEGQNCFGFIMLLTKKLNIWCDFFFFFFWLYKDVRDTTFYFFSLDVALEAVSGMKTMEVVGGAKTAVSMWVDLRSSLGTFFLGI